MFLLIQALLLTRISIIPHPNSISVLDDSSWTLFSGMEIGYDDTISSFGKELSDFISDTLYVPTGIRLNVVESGDVKLGIQLGISEDDEYHLLMNSNRVTILGKNRELIFNGFQTLLQLLPPQIYSSEKVENIEWTAPCVFVSDKPRFQWRGIMIDISRRFIEIDQVKMIIDAMSHFKLNTLHLHLTDDQGWRIELPNYPNLTTIGAYRESSPKKWDRGHTDGVPYGPFYYSYDEMKDLILYAKNRSITIVPEIDMPGHTLCLLSCYPQYSCTGGPFKPKCLWGPDQEIICVGNDEAIQFLEKILDDVMELFDSTYIHCGGDEVIKTRWQSCPKCQQRIKDESLLGLSHLQGWFTEHFTNYLTNHKRKLIGWDEILDGDYPLPASAIVMSWQGVSGGLKAARLGLDVVMSPSTYLYLDHYQFDASEPYEYIGNLLTANQIYRYDPYEGLEEKYQNHILGVQGNIWTAYIWNKDELQWKTYPRILGVAEIGWTFVENKNWVRFMNDYTNHESDVFKYFGVVDAGLQYGTLGKWEKGELSENKWISIEFPVDGCLDAKGHIEAAFVNRAEGKKCSVRNVKFLLDSAVVAEDDHEGVISDDFSDDSSLYTFHITQKPTGKISIQAEMMCVDSDECEGVIYIYSMEVK